MWVNIQRPGATRKLKKKRTISDHPIGHLAQIKGWIVWKWDKMELCSLKWMSGLISVDYPSFHLSSSSCNPRPHALHRGVKLKHQRYAPNENQITFGFFPLAIANLGRHVFSMWKMLSDRVAAFLFSCCPRENRTFKFRPGEGIPSCICLRLYPCELQQWKMRPSLSTLICR